MSPTDESDSSSQTLEKVPPSDPPTPTPELEDDFPHGFKLLVLMIALSLAVFLVALDNSIITTAIPKITDQFKSLDDVGWYGSVYLLALAATQLLFGKFYTFLPVKLVFLVSISLFELGSLVCGLAPNSIALIMGRTIAGLGSAGIFTGALIIIAHSVPLEKRPLYTGLIGSMYGIASVAGPLMGGVFTDKVLLEYSRFLTSLVTMLSTTPSVNLPIGAVTVVVITFFFKMPKSGTAERTESQLRLTLREKIAQFDPWGTLAFIPAIVSLLLALQWGGSKYPWDSPRIITLFVLFGVFIITFVAIQIWQQENATVPPRIFLQRSICAGGLFNLCIGASFMLIVFYLPIWFQAIKGTTAIKSGIDCLPMILSMVLASLFAGGLTTAFGYYTPFILSSSVLMAVGAGVLSTFKTNTGHAHWIGYQVIFGFGFGLGTQGPLMAAQTVLDLKDVPIGTTINNFLQTLAWSSTGIIFNQFTLFNKLISGIVAHVPGVSPEIVFEAGATNLQNAVEPQYLSAVLEVYNDALMSAFQVSIAMAAISLVGAAAMEWRSVKGKKIEMVLT
ncbi:Major facilitator superfamily transporter [Mycena sanguinolenta]|uniref:Major facilitator superfamily transporter n=1 Tax=Mycena sanguinolenta TaxID=230812 RepID=A0A8H6ZCG6_9AGAR|nr:Major facilitator superfamily transporter [Mycena sanguinolenta]